MATLDGGVSDRRIPRLSVGVAVALTLFGCGLVLREFTALLVPSAVGALGGVALGGALWISGRHRSSTALCVAGVLVVLGGIGVSGSIAVGSLLLIEQTFPVDTVALVSVGALTVAGHTGIVLGCTLAAFGVALSLWSPTPADIRRSTLVVAWVGILPLLTALALLFSTTIGFNLGALVVTPLATAGESLVLPRGPGLHLWSLGFLLTITAASASVLFDGSERISPIAVGAGIITLVTFGFEMVVSPLALQSVLGTSYGPIRAVSTTPSLRLLLLFATVPAVVAVVDRVITPVTRATTESDVEQSGAIAAGLLVTGGTLAAANGIYNWLIEETIRLVPEEIEGDIDEMATEAAAVFGEASLILVMGLLCIGTAATLVLLSGRAREGSAFSTDAVGPSVASLGLFLAVVFAATLDAPPWLVVAGIGASLLVWDAGRFGATLAREVRGGSVTRIEVVHLSGVVVVGLVGAAIALLVIGQFPAEPGESSPSALLALFSLVIGLSSLVVALR